MDIKQRPNHSRYLDILRQMTPAQRLEKSFELTQYARDLLKAGLRRANPGLGETELHQKYLDRIKQCHNVNF